MARSLSPDKARLVAIRATRLTGEVRTFTHWAEPAGSRPLAPFVEIDDLT